MLATRGDVDWARSMFAEAMALYETIGMFCLRARLAMGSVDSNYRKITSASCMTVQRLLSNECVTW